MLLLPCRLIGCKLTCAGEHPKLGGFLLARILWLCGVGAVLGAVFQLEARSAPCWVCGSRGSGLGAGLDVPRPRLVPSCLLLHLLPAGCPRGRQHACCAQCTWPGSVPRETGLKRALLYIHQPLLWILPEKAVLEVTDDVKACHALASCFG